MISRKKLDFSAACKSLGLHVYMFIPLRAGGIIPYPAYINHYPIDVDRRPRHLSQSIIVVPCQFTLWTALLVRNSFDRPLLSKLTNPCSVYYYQLSMPIIHVAFALHTHWCW
jgi:hypothetical protein